MSGTIEQPTEASVGSYLAKLREAAGMTQAQLAQSVALSSATVSRIESGDKPPTTNEVDALLKAIGTEAAAQFAEFLHQEWDQLPQPAFDHPNRAALWEANVALGRLADLRADETLTAVFLRQVDLYESELRRLAAFLASREHQIAFIGGIGVGKSTSICKLTKLLKPGEDKPDKQNV